MAHALIVDDDKSFVPALAEFVSHEGYSVHTVENIHDARIAYHEQSPDLMLLDLVLPDGNGLSLLEDLRAAHAQTKFMVITGYPDVDSAVHAFRGNAVDYFSKPLDIDAFRSRLKDFNTQKFDALAVENNDHCTEFTAMIGRSTAINSMCREIAKVGPTRAAVLITGESGTGKELAAAAIHETSGRSGSFVAVDCGAVSKELISNELFGHERGSYTGATQRHKGVFERAHMGTLFLDEITEMPLDTQAHLLRVLETGVITRLGGADTVKVDVRIVAATNRDPARAVADRVLREDLYYRLNVFPIHLPPLRERGADVEELAWYFLAEFNHSENTTKSFSKQALTHIRSYYWPGNVRELKHCILRGFILAQHIIDAEHLSTSLRKSIEISDSNILSFKFGTSLDEIEQRVIQGTLEHYKADKRLAADVLGISLKTLYNKLQRYSSD